MSDKDRTITENQEKKAANNTFRVDLKFNYEADADIKKWQETIQSIDSNTVQGHIKRLIRKDIARAKNSKLEMAEYLKREQAKYKEKLKEEKDKKKKSKKK